MNYPCLTQLNISRCDNIGIDGFAAIRSLTSLRELSISCCSALDDDALCEFAPSLTRLTNLDLASTGVSEEGLLYLPSSVSVLSLNNCAGIRDQSTQQLSLMTSLRSLDLSNCLITDEGL